MTPISFAGTGAIITVIEAVLRLLNVDFPEGSVAAAINGAFAFVGFILLIYGQLRRKDLKFGLLRK